MKIEILGGGCARCGKLYERTRKAVESAGLDAEVIKDEKFETIIKYGITTTPALVVDGVVKSSGKVLSPAEIIPLLIG